MVILIGVPGHFRELPGFEPVLSDILSIFLKCDENIMLILTWFHYTQKMGSDKSSRAPPFSLLFTAFI